MQYKRPAKLVGLFRYPTNLILFGIVLFLWACSSASHNQALPQNPPAAKGQSSSSSEINQALATLAASVGTASTEYQVGAEDLLQITVYNVPEKEVGTMPRTITTRVTHQGTIALPVLGEIKVAGLTLRGLERELAKRYEKYLYHPQVGVLVTEYRQRMSVIGAVQKPGVLDLTGPKTVIDVLAMAGGVNEKAGTQVHIYRQGPKGRESHVIDLVVLASNASLITADNAGLITMPVQAGDVINVPQAGTFFVDGAVKNPGPFPLGRRYTLSQALTTAGGVDRELYSSDITIFRRKGGAIESIPVDLDAIHAGSAVDPQIEADDVIVVPRSTGKYLLHRFVGQLIGGISIGSFIGGS